MYRNITKKAIISDSLCDPAGFQKIEIISGISAEEELLKPTE
jgi:hypothetical protein